MDGLKATYSYERGKDNKYRVTHRENGEVVATIDNDSSENELQMALKSWILSPDLRKTVEGWLRAQRRPAKTTTKSTTKTKRQSTKAGAVTVTRME